ncbi:hypothetical protein JCM10213_008991 [Rhodosporidiobolus nylandii]
MASIAQGALPALPNELWNRIFTLSLPPPASYSERCSLLRRLCLCPNLQEVCIAGYAEGYAEGSAQGPTDLTWLSGATNLRRLSVVGKVRGIVDSPLPALQDLELFGSSSLSEPNEQSVALPFTHLPSLRDLAVCPLPSPDLPLATLTQLSAFAFSYPSSTAEDYSTIIAALSNPGLPPILLEHELVSRPDAATLRMVVTSCRHFKLDRGVCTPCDLPALEWANPKGSSIQRGSLITDARYCLNLLNNVLLESRTTAALALKTLYLPSNLDPELGDEVHTLLSHAVKRLQATGEAVGFEVVFVAALEAGGLSKEFVQRAERENAVRGR